jgi:hypothetical protein
MATNSRIGMEYRKEDGSLGIKSVYCHFDGYLSGVGNMLIENYATQEKVEEVVALGDISYLTEKLEPTGPHTFNTPEEGVTVAYHRDRGEAFHQGLHGSREDYFRKSYEYYVYLFTEDGRWLISDGREPKQIRKKRE